MVYRNWEFSAHSLPVLFYVMSVLLLCANTVANPIDVGGPGLQGVPALQLPHYVAPFYNSDHYNSSDPTFLQFVRLTHTCPFDLTRIDDGRKRDLEACVGGCRLFNGTVSLKYSPFIDYFHRKCQSKQPCKVPSEEEIRKELDSFDKMAVATHVELNKQNIAQKTCVQASTFLFDAEVFEVQQDPKDQKVIADAYTAMYNKATETFPGITVLWYSRGSVMPYPRCFELKDGKCWDDSQSESLFWGHNIGASFYFLGCTLDKDERTDEQWRRNGHKAERTNSTDGFPSVFTPWVSLGAGWAAGSGPAGDFNCTGDFTNFTFTWDYNTNVSHSLGANINAPRNGSQWDLRVPVVPVLYPAPLNDRSDFVDSSLGRMRASWKHFVYYALGAAGLTTFPANQNVSAFNIIPACSVPPTTTPPTTVTTSPPTTSSHDAHNDNPFHSIPKPATYAILAALWICIVISAACFGWILLPRGTARLSAEEVSLREHIVN